ncbi:perlucin-like protein isoform X2 [Mytilus trossulus]|uniref:perlucin-like protein isoform X2 n=1 Tax=Mytilus trossulus TaxID=6551 RepID=UPI0030044B31
MLEVPSQEPLVFANCNSEMFVYVILLSCCLSLISAESCLGNQEESLLNDIKSAIQKLEIRLKDKSFRCSPGWKEHANHCYNFISTPVTWNEAERACRKIGGYLVKVDNESESNWLKQEANVEEKSFWAGAADFNEGDWRWIVDFSNVTFTDWHTGQPDNSGGHEDCLEIEKSYNYQWNDVVCTIQNGYICESEKGGACIPYSKLFRK